MITAIYAAVLGLWLAFLFLHIVRLRYKHKVGLGTGGQEELQAAIRIHGNFTETVPYILILMILIEMMYGHHGWLIHLFGVALVASRLLHFRGLKKSAGVTRERFAAGILTVGSLVTGSAILLFAALANGFIMLSS